MQYEIIVFGATFTAAGIAQKYSDDCLIVEQSTSAGREFLGALNFGSGYNVLPKSSEAKTLLQKFSDKNAFHSARICLYDCTPLLYKLLEGKNVLLNTEIISVDKVEDVFVCTLHGVCGYRTVKAKKVIDTRTHIHMCQSKTYNFLIDGVGDLNEMPGVIYEKWGFEHNYVLRCSVALDADYIDAHKIADRYVKNLPGGYKLLYLADDFDYEIKSEYPQVSEDVVYLPSKSFENPILAFDAGVLFEAGGNL